MFRLSRRGRRLALLSVIAGMLLGVQPASAFTVVSRTGSTGPYALTDSAAPVGQQGATCSYDATSFNLAKIQVRGPQVKARNRTSTRDSQWVGWQFIVQQQAPSGGPWTTLHGSTFVKARAYDNLAASFGERGWTAPASPSGKYRVLVVIRWYTPGTSSTIQGQAKLLDSFYRATWTGNSYVNESFCLQSY